MVSSIWHIYIACVVLVVAEVLCAKGCSVNNNNVDSFDGLVFDYTWLNDCSYYLFHSDESRYDDEFFYITAHFKVFHVSPQTSFIESINISVAGHNYTIIKGEAFLNGIHVSLPYKSEKINIKEIEGTKGTILAVLWNGVSATTELVKTFTGFLAEKIDIGITAEFIYKTKGICGFMDDDDANDMMAPDGTLCSDVESFTESWKVPGSCTERFGMPTYYTRTIFKPVDTIQ